MTTPQPPKPPAAGELSDADLTRIARDAELEYIKAHGGWSGLDPNGIAKQDQMAELVGHRAVAAAAIAADRARHPQQEEMAEALRRLRRWGALSFGWDSQTTLDVIDWIDAGMTGPLPPLPPRIVARQEVKSP